MKIFTTILDILFPRKCVFCAKILNKGDDGLCDNCVESLPYADNYGYQKGEIFDFCISPLYYTDVVRQSILRYKFGNASYYSDEYAKVLADCIKECPDLKYDIISWVPLSKKRERKRGYDQAMLLATKTADNLGKTAEVVLRKHRDVQPQSELGNKTERSANISGAYEATNPEIIKNKHILLIDDVITTGSTLDECAGVLLSAGAAGITGATLAKGD